MPEHGDLLVCQSSLDAAGVISQVIIISSRSIVENFFLRTVTPVGFWKMLNLKCPQITLPHSINWSTQPWAWEGYSYHSDSRNLHLRPHGGELAVWSNWTWVKGVPLDWIGNVTFLFRKAKLAFYSVQEAGFSGALLPCGVPNID